MIIVDNQSKDGTIAIAKKFIDKYPFIRLYSENDEGIYDAMNKGIERAFGDWVGIFNVV